MMAAVRTSRRAMFGAILSGIFVILTLFAVKDMHDKLGVMTASNTGYQKMIDTQNERISKLNQELKDSKNSHKWDVDSFQKKGADALAKVQKAEGQVTVLKNQLEKTKKELDRLHQTHETEMTQMEEDQARMQRLNEDLQHAKEAREEELRQQIVKITNEHENCKAQYIALFKQHQDSQDMIQKLQSTSKVNKSPATKPSSRPTKAVAAAHLEDPRSAGRLPQLVPKQQTSNSPPVAQEPPLAHPQSEVVPLVHLNSQTEDDDPKSKPLQQPRLNPRNRKIVYGQVKRPNGQNLDQEVDNVQQDHPNLPGPLDTGRLDHGFQQQEEENEADDAVDGRIPHQDSHGYGGHLGLDDVGVFGANVRYDQNEIAPAGLAGLQRVMAYPKIRQQGHPQVVYGHRGL